MLLWQRHTSRMFFYVAFSCRSTNLFSDRPIDTNVLAVKFSLLSEPGHLHTGDAIVCCNEKCAAVLNHLSKLSEVVGKKEKVMFNINVGSMLIRTVKRQKGHCSRSLSPFWVTYTDSIVHICQLCIQKYKCCSYAIMIVILKF